MWLFIQFQVLYDVTQDTLSCVSPFRLYSNLQFIKFTHTYINISLYNLVVCAILDIQKRPSQGRIAWTKKNDRCTGYMI